MTEDLGTSHVSLFPMPPWQLINKYTDTAVKQDTAPQPPTPIESSMYRMFGSVCNSDDPILRPLESHGVKRVYPQQYNRKKELRKLNFSLLASYLDLLDVVTKDPLSPKRTDKTDHIGILFINMHHLVNEYRPHQARDLLHEILTYQVEVSTETTDKSNQYLSKADEYISAAAKCLEDDNGEDKLDDLDPDLQELLSKLSSDNLTSSDLRLPPSLTGADCKTEPSEIKPEESDIPLNDEIDSELWKFLNEMDE